MSRLNDPRKEVRNRQFSSFNFFLKGYTRQLYSLSFLCEIIGVQCQSELSDSLTSHDSQILFFRVTLINYSESERDWATYFRDLMKIPGHFHNID